MTAGVVPDAHALRCNGSLVSEGDRRFEVRRACGEADFVWQVRDPRFARYAPYEEVWYYNRGPQRLIRALHFRNARLRRIETAGYGFRERDTADRPCRPADLRAGMTAYELLHTCGEPVERTYTRVRHVPHAHDPHRYEERVVEDWFYAEDVRYLPRRVRIRDGIVIDVTTRFD